MAIAARRPTMTADEFLALGEQLPPTAQLIDGEVVIVTSPNLRHQHIVLELCVRLRAWIAAAPGRGQCGIPADVKLDDRNVFAPDAWWCCEARKPGLDAVRLPAVPDLAVEVLSPSTRRHDLGRKRHHYEHQGLPELWFVDPKRRQATLLRRSTAGGSRFDLEVGVDAEGVLASPQLPGFEVALDQLLG